MPYMLLESTLICIFAVSGAHEQCPPKEIILAMATYIDAEARLLG